MHDYEEAKNVAHKEEYIYGSMWDGCLVYKGFNIWIIGLCVSVRPQKYKNFH